MDKHTYIHHVVCCAPAPLQFRFLKFARNGASGVRTWRKMDSGPSGRTPIARGGLRLRAQVRADTCLHGLRLRRWRCSMEPAVEHGSPSHRLRRRSAGRTRPALGGAGCGRPREEPIQRVCDLGKSPWEGALIAGASTGAGCREKGGTCLAAMGGWSENAAGPAEIMGVGRSCIRPHAFRMRP